MSLQPSLPQAVGKTRARVCKRPAAARRPAAAVATAATPLQAAAGALTTLAAAATALAGTLASTDAAAAQPQPQPQLQPQPQPQLPGAHPPPPDPAAPPEWRLRQGREGRRGDPLPEGDLCLQRGQQSRLQCQHCMRFRWVNQGPRGLFVGGCTNCYRATRDLDQLFR